MAEFARPISFESWAGTPGDLAEVAQLAFDAISKNTGKAPSISVQVTLRDLVVNRADLLPLENFADFDIPKLRSIRVRIGDYNKTSVTMTVDHHSPVLTVMVEGDDRTHVEGLAARLHQHLSRGQDFPRRIGYFRRLLFFSFPFLVVLTAANNIIVSRQPHGFNPPGAGVFLAVDITVVLVLLAANIFGPSWLFRPLEIHPLGTQTRWQRFRKGVISTIAAVAIGLIVAVIWALIGH